MPGPPNSLSIGTNTIWLTLFSLPDALLIQTRLLGLGPDHSLLCALTDQHLLPSVQSGTPCKGRSFIDGEMYEFETIIQEILSNPPSLRLEAPSRISRQHPRSFPRLAVDLPGTVRPLNEQGNILAVLPVRIANISPTGCQFTVTPSAWPMVSSCELSLSCRLPGSHHVTNFSGSIEWIQPAQELLIGTRFSFSTPSDIRQQELLKWYSSQKANFINTTA